MLASASLLMMILYDRVNAKVSVSPSMRVFVSTLASIETDTASYCNIEIFCPDPSHLHRLVKKIQQLT